MPIKVGNTTITAVHVGSEPITSMYVGETLVYTT
jgi:hypothetical protein